MRFCRLRLLFSVAVPFATKPKQDGARNAIVVENRCEDSWICIRHLRILGLCEVSIRGMLENQGVLLI